MTSLRYHEPEPLVSRFELTDGSAELKLEWAPWEYTITLKRDRHPVRSTTIECKEEALDVYQRSIVHLLDIDRAKRGHEPLWLLVGAEPEC